MIPCSGQFFFDPRMPIGFYRKKLPHMEQSGKIEFVTFRLNDSMPHSVMLHYKELKDDFMRNNPYPWNLEIYNRYIELISNPLEKYVDAGYGSCVLKNPNVRKFLVDAIQYYDNDKYFIWAYVIMPNHVHMLISPTPGYELLTYIQSVMKFSATRINRYLGKKGRLWQGEPFDRLIRNENHYANSLEYIKQNPTGLSTGMYEFGGFEFSD